MDLLRELECLFGSPRERHPLPDSEGSYEERVRRLEVHAARLWDQVWWLSLPWWKRAIYRARGFRAPIGRFYEPRE